MGTFAVDIDVELGSRDSVCSECERNFGMLGHGLVGDFARVVCDVLDAAPDSVLNVALEVAAHTDAVDGGRGEHERIRLGHALFKCHIGFAQNPVERDTLGETFHFGLQADEYRARVADFCECRAAQTRDCGDILNAVEFGEK